MKFNIPPDTSKSPGQKKVNAPVPCAELVAPVLVYIKRLRNTIANWRMLISLPACILLAIVIVPNSIQAQDGDGDDTPPTVTPKTPLQIEAEQAQFQAQLDEALFNSAENKKKLSELNDIKSDYVPPVAGVTTKDNAGYYGELLSFLTLDEVADQIVENIPNAGVKTCECDDEKEVPFGKEIVVSSKFEMAQTAALWHLMQNQFKSFENSFPSLFTGIPVKGDEEFAVAPILATLGVASQIAAFFKVKQEVSGRTIEASTEALEALVAKKLRVKNYKPILPGLIQKFETGLAKRIISIEELEKSAQKRKKARIVEAKKPDHNVDLEKLDKDISDVNVKLKKVGLSDADKALLETKLDKLNFYKSWWDKQSSDLKLVSKEFKALIDRLKKVPEGQSQSPLEQLFVYEVLVGDKENMRFLTVKTLSQGADMETSSGALRKTKISFVGGSVGLFYLSDAKGNILASDVIPIVSARSFTTRIETNGSERVQ